jgi:hypothetical protein
MRRHVKELRRRLRSYRARQWKIDVAGTDLSGRYLLWHAMNIRSVGPVLTLAADAKTNNGTSILSAHGRRTALCSWIISVRERQAKDPSFHSGQTIYEDALTLEGMALAFRRCAGQLTMRRLPSSAKLKFG